MFYKTEKTKLIIDGSALSAATGYSGGYQIDFKKLREHFSKTGNLRGCYYYANIVKDEDGFSHARKIVDWMSFNGYRIVTRESDESANRGYVDEDRR